MIHLALLRGINVGGKNRVEMARLRALFESLGCADVRTFIASGNVVFDDARASAQLRTLIESAISEEFGFDARIVLRERAPLVSLAESIPPTWKDDSTMRCYVMFLWEAVDRPAVVDELPIKPGIDDVVYAPGAVIWRVDRDKLTRSGMAKLPGTDLYQQMTIRNGNTVRKLADIMRTMS